MWCGLNKELKVNERLVHWQGNSWETGLKWAAQGHDRPAEVAGAQLNLYNLFFLAGFPRLCETNG